MSHSLQPVLFVGKVVVVVDIEGRFKRFERLFGRIVERARAHPKKIYLY
jgi:hypothetical protein